MAVKIKDIPGALVEKLDRIYWPHKKVQEGYNLAITQQGEVQITLNREELAKTIWEEETLQGSLNRPTWENARPYQKHIYYKFADAILNALPELVEVVK